MRRAVLFGGATAVLIAACASGGPIDATGPQATAERVTAALNSDDVERVTDLMAKDGVVPLGDNFVLALDKPLAEEALWIADIFGLDSTSRGIEVFGVLLETLAVWQTRYEVDTCHYGDHGAVRCSARSSNAYERLDDTSSAGVLELVVENGWITMLRLPLGEQPTGEVLGGFLQWAAIHHAEASIDDFANPGALMAALEAWEHEARPHIARPNVGTDPIAVVEAWIGARNSGDWGTQAALSTGEVLSSGFGSYHETMAAVALDREIHLNTCEVTMDSTTVGAFVACDVSVTDIIVGAAGVEADSLNDSTFLVVGGLVAKPPGWMPSSQLAEAAVEEWGTVNDRAAYEAACPTGIAGQDIVTGLDCACWIAASHPDWVAAVEAVGLQ